MSQQFNFGVAEAAENAEVLLVCELCVLRGDNAHMVELLGGLMRLIFQEACGYAVCRGLGICCESLKIPAKSIDKLDKKW